MKKKNIFFYSLTLLFSGLSLIGCDKHSLNTQNSISESESNVQNEMVTVTYYRGEHILSTQDVLQGSLYSPAFTPDDEEMYYFNGWYFDPDFVEKVTDHFVVSGDMALYAQFVLKEPDPEYYTITFDFNQGIGDLSLTETLEENTDYTLPDGTVLSRKNYLFDGWLCLNDGQVYQSLSEYKVIEDVTFQAIWARAVTISFDVDGSISQEIVKVNSDIVLPSCDAIKDDYEFVGWSTSNQIYAPGDSFFVSADQLTFTALWSGNYLVRFDLDGGTGIVNDQRAMTGNKIALPDQINKPDYDFVGWSDGENLYTSEYEIKYQDVILVAVYVESVTTYEVLFMDWSGSSIIKTVSVKENEGVEEPLDTYVYQIPEFIGWDKDFSCVNAENTTNGRLIVRATYENQDKWMDKSKMTFTLSTDKKGYLVTSTSKLQSDIGKDLYLPCSYNGRPVIGIAAPGGLPAAADPTGFYQCMFIENVYFPSTFTSIPANAFFNCGGIQHIYFAPGSQLESIGATAFYSNESLLSVEFPATLKTLGSSAFSQCDQLSSVTFLGDLLTAIPTTAFYRCFNLQEISLPSSITSIGNSAFAECSALQTIVIPENVETIGQAAFNYCTGLISVDFRTNKVTTIVDNTFFGCHFSSITLPASITTLSNKCFALNPNLEEVLLKEGTQLETIGERIFTKNTNLKRFNSTVDGEFIVPASVKTIADFAFVYVPNMQKIIFEEGSILESIGNYAFSCQDVGLNDTTIIENQLQEIVIPSTVISLGENMFYQCSALQTIEVDKDNPFYCVENQLLMNKEKTVILAYPTASLAETLMIPEGVLTIPDKIFANAVHLKEVTIPSTVISIGEAAFKNAQMLEIVHFDAVLVKSIPVECFAYCSSLKTVLFASDNQIETLEQECFRSCTSLSSITIPENVITVGVASFYLCEQLDATLIFSEECVITRLEEACFGYAFKADSQLVIPSSVQVIDGQAFLGTTNLIAVSFAEQSTCEEIGSHAFEDSGIRTFTLPSSVSRIGTFAFNFTLSLTDFSFEEASSLQVIPASCFAYSGLIRITLPSTIVTISEYAFSATKLVDMIVPDSVISFGKQVFYACRQLESVTLSDYLEELPIHTFSGCSSLQSVTLGNNLKIINNFCFYETSSLKTIHLPENVHTLGMACFKSSGIETVYVSNPSPAVFMSVSNGITENIAETVFNPETLQTIYVPASRLNVYQSSWNYYRNYLVALSDD